MSSIIFDFKGVRDACDAISSDIMGPRAEKMHDCPICDEPFDPDTYEEDERCSLCKGTMKVGEKTMIREGYLEPPEPAQSVNCVVCMDQGYQIKQQGLGNYHVPCGCPAGAKWAQSQAQAQKSIGISVGGAGGGGGKAPSPVPQAAPVKKRGY